MNASVTATSPDDLILDGDALTTPRKLRWLTLVGIVCANILVCVLEANSLFDSKRLHEKAAEHVTQNIAAALDLNVSKDIQKVDLALRSVVDELEHRLSTGAIDVEKANTFLAKIEQRLPEVEAIRGAGVDGLVMFGKGAQTATRISWGDKPYFMNLRDYVGAALQVSGPDTENVSKRYALEFSRRFNYPDGSFAGVVSASIALEHFTSLLSKFDVGPNGTLILRDSNLGLISRMPPLPDNAAGQIGNRIVSPDFRRAFDAGAEAATNVTAVSPDGFRRIFTFRRLSEAPIVAIAASAQQDYLAAWRGEVYRSVAIVAGFLLLSSLTAAYVLRLLRQNEMGMQEIRAGKFFVANILDSLTEHIVVVDARGFVIAVNAAWRRFGATNGVSSDARISIGANYLEVCSGAFEVPYRDDAKNARAGVKAVLDGEQQEFLMEYACHSPTEQRWFVLHVMPLLGNDTGAVIIHQNVTHIHQAQSERKVSEDKFRLIAENTSDGVVIFDANHSIQYVSPAYLHQLGFSHVEQLEQSPQTIPTLIHPEDRDPIFASIHAAIEARLGDILYTYRIRHTEGYYFWREDHARFVYDDAGALHATYVICRDVTERKAEEENRQRMAQRLEELSRRLVQAQEHARHHLARELHELTSPNLAALRINLAILAKSSPAERNEQEFIDRVADTRALIDDTTSSIRDICSELHSTVLEGGGMVGVLQNYARQLAKRTGMQVSVHCFHAEVHLAPALALPLFRIVQEALTNCAKHSRASVVDITLRLTSQPMQLIISDDGIGFDPSASRRLGSGLGLMNMRETAQFIGGTLNLISGAGAGTTVTVSVALAPHERDA